MLSLPEDDGNPNTYYFANYNKMPLMRFSIFAHPLSMNTIYLI